jgi:hypothetical protein
MAHHHAHHDPKGDAKAAFTGLLVGAIAILAICYTIITLTNRKFASHAAAPAATTAPAAPH